MKVKQIVLIAGAIFAVSFIIVIWLQHGSRISPLPRVSAPDPTPSPDNDRDYLGAAPDEARRWLNAQRVPNATTPFRQRMRDGGYALDSHTHEWYSTDVAGLQYHCTWLVDYVHHGTYLSCPGQRPPGISDQPGN